MKKRLLSLVLTVAVLALSVSGVLGIFSVNASGTYDVIPDMGYSEDMFTIRSGSALANTLGSEGKSGENHPNGYSKTTPAERTFTNPGLATAGYRYFEFDFYLDNYSVISSRNIKLYLNLRTSGGSKGIIQFQDQITEDGWNHVTIPMNSIPTSTGASTFTSSDDLNSIDRVRLYMDRDEDAGSASDKYSMANICATKYAYDLIPAMVEASPRFDIKNGVLFSSTLGSASKTGQQHPNGYDGSSPAEKTFTNPGLSSDYGFFEFDFYVDNYTNFTARNAKMYLGLRVYNNGNYIATYEFTDQITESGWNHIKVIADTSDSNLDNTGRVRFFTDIDAGSTGENDRYRVANICATRDEYRFIPSMAAADFRYDMYDGDTFHGTIGSSRKNGDNPDPYNPASKSFSQTTLSDYANFEFDFYIDNYSNFTARNTDFEFRLRNSSNANRGKCLFGDQITKDGWNHIKISRYSLKVDSGIAPDDSDLNSAVNFRLYITVDAGETGATDRYKMANVCATKRAEYKTHSLVLTDSIGINFFMDLSDLKEAEKAASYMTFEIPHGSNKTSAFNGEFTGTGGTYGFTCPVSSVQMAESIIPTFHYSSAGVDKTVTGDPYSVKDYIDYAIENSSSVFGDKATEGVALVKAIGDYGHYAQTYLGAKNGWSAGANYTALAKYRAADYTSSDYSTKKSTISSKEISTSGITNGGNAGKYFQYALNLDYETSILIKFNTGNITFTSVQKGGVNYENRKNAYTADNCTLYLYYLPVTQLGDTITVAGNVEDSPYTINISALSYVYAVLDSGSTSAAHKNVAGALYDYYTAAVAYQTSFSS